MRALILMSIVAAAAATALPTPGSAQTTPFCIAGRGCVPTTQASYNSCFQLALSRGLTVSRGDLHNLNSFIYQCLQGRIPR
jgi:hypothetical protein